MSAITKYLVTDEQLRPIAVQIPYEEWLDIERRLNGQENPHPPTDLSRHAGRLDWPLDGLDYQQEVRSEWQ